MSLKLKTLDAADAHRTDRRFGRSTTAGSPDICPPCYQCTPLVSVAIAICSNEAFSSTSAWPFDAAESGNTR
jgi:hypothetical protein